MSEPAEGDTTRRLALVVKLVKWLVLGAIGIAAIYVFDLSSGFLSRILGSTRDVPEESVSANLDFPVVVPVKGGMLEVASVTGTRSIPRATDPEILGQALSFCREKASWSVPYKITYRLKLGEKWPLRYRNGTLYARVPELEPSLPVAFDTRRTREGASESCWFIPDLGTRKRAFKAISPELAKLAQSPETKKFAREAARKTVIEFLRTWALNQKQYPEVDPDAEIRVFFPGE
jgi:hypothetical protein